MKGRLSLKLLSGSLGTLGLLGVANPNAGQLGSSAALMWITIVIYNFAIAAILQIALKTLNWNQILMEKRALWVTGGANNGKTPYSYSRAVGTVGGVIIACLFWAIGTYVIFNLYENQDFDVSVFARGVWPLFYAGAALFIPYVANALTSIGGTPQQVTINRMESLDKASH